MTASSFVRYSLGLLLLVVACGSPAVPPSPTATATSVPELVVAPPPSATPSPTGTATPTPTPTVTPSWGDGVYRIDAVNVNVRGFPPEWTATFDVTVTLVSGDARRIEPLWMSVNGREPVNVREIEGLQVGESGPFGVIQRFKQGNHRVTFFVQDSAVYVIVNVPLPTPTRTPTPVRFYVATPTPFSVPVPKPAPTQVFSIPLAPTATPTITIPKLVIATPPTITFPKPVIATPVPPQMVISTPTPLVPTIVLPTQIPVIPAILPAGNPTTPTPTAATSTSELTEEEELNLANAVMTLVVDSVFAQSSFTSDALVELGGSELWKTNYANINMDYEHWLAVGTATYALTGRHIEFDSRYGSTCLRQTEPKSTDWTYGEHVGWANSQNPAVFTPMLPTLALRTNPQPQWRVIDLTDSLITISHDRYPNGLAHILQVDRQTFLIVNEVSIQDSTVINFVEYIAYGENRVFDVHQDQQDCEARN